VTGAEGALIPDATANGHRSPVRLPAAGLRTPRLPGLAAAARLVGAPAEAMRILREAAGQGGTRPVWAGGGRLHVAVHGVDPERLDAFVVDLEARAGCLPGVAWAALDAGCGRLVIAGVSSAGPDEDAVIAAVEAAEVAAGASGSFAAFVAEHPADRIGAARHTLEATADVAAIITAAAGAASSVLRLPQRWQPVDLGAVIGLIQNQDRLRGPLERRFGTIRTDATLSMAGAVAHGLRQRMLAPSVDLVQRVLLVRQEDSRAATFSRLEPTLYSCPPSRHPSPLCHPAERPVPLPGGPIERYADSALVATVAAALATVSLSDRTRAASAVLSAGVPKAARLGREAFAAGTAEFLGRCGVLVVRPESLRLLDRLDCLVVDPHVLAAADFEVGSVVPTADVPTPECHRRASALLAATLMPGWDLVPLVGTPMPGTPNLLYPADETLLSLRSDGRSVAVVELHSRSDQPGARLLAAAADAGMEVLLTRPGGYESAHVLDGGDTAAAVVHLQREGRVVACVAAPDEPALATADCGIAVVQRPDQPVPWHADLIAADGLGGAAALLGACALARDVSRHGVILALAGSTMSAAATLRTPVAGRRLPRPRLPVSLGVDLAALAAVTHGHLSSRRLTPPVSAQSPHVAWHRLPVANVLARLGSGPQGLSATEAGTRRIPAAAEPTPLQRLTSHFGDELLNPLTPVLAIGAGLSLAVGSVIDAAMVASVVVADAGIGAVQQFQAERAIAALDRTAVQQVRVRRDDVERVLPAAELVVGDVICLAAGEDIPADCRLLDNDGLETDESSLTGESLPVAKAPAPTDAGALAERSCMLYAGTAVAAGRGTAVVVATGAGTAAGCAAAGAKAPRTGVEARLEALAAGATPIALGAGAAIIASSLLRGRPLPETLTTGVSLAVAAVPEGLPILATAAQLAASKRLAAHGVLVRNVRAIEALGRVDVLCVDKTGTLTEGILQVASVHDGLRGTAPQALEARHQPILAIAAAVATATPPERRRPGSTDDAIVIAAAALPRQADPLAELAYESGRGYHAVAFGDADGPVLAAVGAPETLLARCTHWQHPNSGRISLDRRRRTRLEGLVGRLAGAGGRVLAVASRQLEKDADSALMSDDDVACLDLVGFLVLADPPRPEARQALQRIVRAGVRPVIITGDHPATARHLAIELGILPDGAAVLTGPELDELDDEALAAILPALAVCARVTPAHKARLVTAYRHLGHCVAMTGDGVNDAAAIRLADVGIALGARSTTAARHAADVVITHDHIGTIVDALLEGRSLWVAVRDAVANLLGHNYGEIGVITGVSLLTGTAPLTARQLLLVNLFTDTVPALTIAMRPPPNLDPAVLLAEGPDRSFGPALTDAIAIRGAATGLAGTAGYLAARLTGTLQRARTVTLLSIVGAQLGQTVLLRPKDPVVLGAAAASGLVLLGIVETPGLSQVFGCRPVGPVGLGVAGFAAAAGTAGTLLPSSAVRGARKLVGRFTGPDQPDDPRDDPRREQEGISTWASTWISTSASTKPNGVRSPKASPASSATPTCSTSGPMATTGT
jgi:magnesium-transporting ATPase (P-type)